MRISVCQLEDVDHYDVSAAMDIVGRAGSDGSDLLVLNEMPIGPWLAHSRTFNEDVASRSIAAHEALVELLTVQPLPVIGSRPIKGRDRLVNEAFLSIDGKTIAVHQKHYFPQESGYWERDWFETNCHGFHVAAVGGISFGVLLCTELMFNEWARYYRKKGAHVIVVPRASGSSMRTWYAAASMAAIVSGCYVVSSNRVGGDPISKFGGKGFIFSPEGQLVAETSSIQSVVTVDIDLEFVREAQTQYPCYVDEVTRLDVFVEDLF